MAALYAQGGVYLDCKSAPIVPFRSYFNPDAEFITFRDVIPSRMLAGFVASVPRSVIVQDILDSSVQKILNGEYGENQLDIGGPHHCGRVLAKYSGDDKVQIAGQRYLFGEFVCDSDNKPLLKRQPDDYMFSARRVLFGYEMHWLLGLVYH
jgi:hypothetical protein